MGAYYVPSWKRLNKDSAMTALPTVLSSLSTKEAITDALYRFVLGLDNADLALFESAFTEDGVFEFNGDVMQGKDTVRAKCYDRISPLDTTHFISNVRVDFKEGDSEASLTASSLAQHYRAKQGLVPNATRLLTGAMYSLKLINDTKSSLWKIKYVNAQLIWTEGDWGVVSGQ